MPDSYPSERVLWTGAPVRVRVFEPVDGILVPLNAVATGALLYLVINMTRIPPAGRLAVGIVIGLVGLYGLVGRFVVLARAIRGSEYTVTDQRFIVTVRALGQRREFTKDLHTLRPPVLRENNDGTGTIRFGRPGLLAELIAAQRGNRMVYPDPLVLHGIPHARWVRDTIAAAQHVVPTD